MEKIFKKLIIASVSILVLAFLSGLLYPDGYLPENLQAINDASDEKVYSGFGLIFWFSLVPVIFLSYYLIYKFKKIGRTLFLICVLLAFPYLYLSGNYVYHPIDSMVEYLIAMIDGALLLLMYASPLKDRFS